MALFENYERRIDKINGVLAQYGISSVEECREICKAKGFDPYEIVKGIQPICFENACWAYTVGAAIAIKSGVKSAAEAAKMIGVGLQSFCIDGSGKKDAAISSPTVSTIRAAGTSSSTSVSTFASTGCVSWRNSRSSTSSEASAPSSTPQKMPGRPCIQKKSKKFISAKLPSRMLVVSPTSVAAPCRLEDTAMAMSTGTGEIFSLRAMARPTGATIKTVATLSTKALMTPANNASMHTAHRK